MGKNCIITLFWIYRSENNYPQALHLGKIGILGIFRSYILYIVMNLKNRKIILKKTNYFITTIVLYITTLTNQLSTTIFNCLTSCKVTTISGIRKKSTEENFRMYSERNGFMSSGILLN